VVTVATQYALALLNESMVKNRTSTRAVPYRYGPVRWRWGYDSLYAATAWACCGKDTCIAALTILEATPVYPTQDQFSHVVVQALVMNSSQTECAQPSKARQLERTVRLRRTRIPLQLRAPHEQGGWSAPSQAAAESRTSARVGAHRCGTAERTASLLAAV
jgi:hypothetical protein